MRIGLVGDLHGNTKAAVQVLAQMGKRKISHVFVLGDFGLWTHVADGHQFLDDVNTVAEGNNLTVFAIGGNHENWDHWEWFVNNMPRAKGFAMVRRRILLAPKAHQFTLANKKFVVAGGAVSVDKEWRLNAERGERDQFGNRIGKAYGPRSLWWPDEQLTDDDVASIKSYGTADILLTHDCSDYTPWKHRLKPDPDSKIHRQRIDEVIRAVKPEFHFHGHMHEQYDWINTLGTDMFGNTPEVEVATYGFTCDGEPNSWGIFDTDTNTFGFEGAGMQFRPLDK